MKLRGRADFLVMVLLQLSGSFSGPRRQGVRNLWEWARDVLAAVPGRCQPIILADVNARLGPPALFRPEGSPVIGSCHQQEETAAGRAMWDFLHEAGLTVLNTSFVVQGDLVSYTNKAWLEKSEIIKFGWLPLLFEKHKTTKSFGVGLVALAC